ncbi:MAG: right-handed parallel beta-helix repeat-containing protein [Hyphomicrobiales bacterium]|nr:MAG: right-handed parallel beta-helix repeat-containing protein [Hyphomicrobiales bacterium]
MKRTTDNVVCLAAVSLLAAVGLAGTARAADIYVSTNGTQTAPYNTWAGAFKDLQAALDYADAKADATIYLAGGQELTGPPYGKEHPYNAVFVWERAVNVRLLGGWDTTAAPPVTRNAGPTILRRTRGDARVMTLAGLSNCVIEQVAFREGCNARPGGVGAYFTNCWNMTLADCVIASNTTSHGGNLGAGLYVNRSYVVLTGSTIADNYCNREYSRGAGLYVDEGSRLTATRSFLLRNKQGGHGGNGAYGGGFYNLGVIELIQTVVSENEADADNVAGGGGVNDGTLSMRNCLVTGNRDSGMFRDGILLSSGSATFINCTIVGNNAVGIRYGGGKVAVSNCIVWGHSAADLLDFPKGKAGVMPDVWYSCVGDGGNNGWQGCFERDPLFVDSIHYHLQSAAGYYANGYFTGGSWAKSAATSPLIDCGTPPPFDFSREPGPNGGRVNLGAYGNTKVASQSPAVTVVKPLARNGGAVTVGHRTVLLRGEAAAGNGRPQAAAFRYWPADGGPTNEIPVGEQFGAFQRPVTNLTPGTAYQFLAEASNPAGAVLSGTGSFRTHPTPSWLYVAANGDNTAGTNWATAYPDVQTALNLAEPGDTVYIAGQVFAGGTAGSAPPHPRGAGLAQRIGRDGARRL